MSVPSEAELRAEEAHTASFSLFGLCDLCQEVHINKEATGERTLGRVWLSVCDAHAYRLDSVARARAAAAPTREGGVHALEAEG